LGDGVDQIWLGDVTTSTSADLNGETDGGTFHAPETNALTGMVKTSLTDA
jgi:hypothetical protein